MEFVMEQNDYKKLILQLYARTEAIQQEAEKSSEEMSKNAEELKIVIDAISKNLSGLDEKIQSTVLQAIKNARLEASDAIVAAQIPVFSQFETVALQAEKNVKAIQREMNLISWKSAIFIVSMAVVSFSTLFVGMWWYGEHLKNELLDLRVQHEIWKEKAPFAEISLCGDSKMPCILVDKSKGEYNSKNEPKKTFMVIKKP
jgi:hypothetical protein